MPLYQIDDVLDLLSESDNDLNDGLDPEAKVNIERNGDDELKVTLTPVDGEGGYADAEAERFTVIIRRAQGATP